MPRGSGRGGRAAAVVACRQRPHDRHPALHALDDEAGLTRRCANIRSPRPPACARRERKVPGRVRQLLRRPAPRSSPRWRACSTRASRASASRCAAPASSPAITSATSGAVSSTWLRRTARAATSSVAGGGGSPAAEGGAREGGGGGVSTASTAATAASAGARARTAPPMGGAGGYDGTEIGAGGKPGVGPAVVNGGRRAGTARPAGEAPLYLQRRKAVWAQERQERAAGRRTRRSACRVCGSWAFDEKAAIMAKLRDEKAEGARARPLRDQDARHPAEEGRPRGAPPRDRRRRHRLLAGEGPRPCRRVARVRG